MDKSATLFKPNSKQLKLLKSALNIEVKSSVTALCEASEIERSTYYRWFENPDFVAWWNEQWASSISRYKWILDKIGLQKAKEDYRYWKAMQDKFTSVPDQNIVLTIGDGDFD